MMPATLNILPLTASILFGLGEALLGLFAFLCAFVVPVVVLGIAGYFIVSLPAKRRERGRLFLNLIRTILRQGKPLEQTLISIAGCRDRSPGVGFHLLAAHLEEGRRFGEALKLAPGLLPPSTAATLTVGESLGDLRAVLPACEWEFDDSRSSLSSALNYFLVIAVVLSPFAVFLLSAMLVWLLPKLKEIFSEGFALESPWLPVTELALKWGVVVEMAMLGFFLIATVAYAAGPLWNSFMRMLTGSLLDQLLWRVPWKRARIRRTFAAMLGVLLDHNVPEPEAIRLAANCTANTCFITRSQRALARLAQGESLTTVVDALDPDNQFRWRLRNATQSRGGFVAALRGWIESLDAQAFRQEQTAAHLISTGIVLLNGLVVGLVCAGVFGLLAEIMKQGLLW